MLVGHLSRAVTVHTGPNRAGISAIPLITYINICRADLIVFDMFVPRLGDNVARP